MTVFNGRIFVGGKDIEDEGAIIAKYFHPQPGEMFFDVGASDAAWTLYALASGASVYAFEPLSVHYQELLDVLAQNPNFVDRCKILNVGLDREDGSKTLYDWYFHLGGHGPELDNLQPDYHTPMKFVKMDSFLPELTRLDWVKMDVEAGEYYVMLGGAETLKKFRPKLLIEDHTNIVRMGVWMKENRIVEKIYTILNDLNYDIIHEPHRGRGFIIATPR